jgi:hypothetical protein
MSIENAEKFLEELKNERDKINNLIYSIEIYSRKNTSLPDYILDYLKEKD